MVTKEVDYVGDLLALVAVRDRSAFRLLYQETSRKILGVLVRIVRDRSDADDVLQDVYVRIWLRAGRFDATKGTGMSWLVAVSRNLALDRLRRSLSRRQILTNFDTIAIWGPNPYHDSDNFPTTSFRARTREHNSHRY